MDIDEASDDKQATALLNLRKQTLEIAKKRKGERPKDMKPLDLLVYKFMVIHSDHETYRSNDKHTIYHSFIAEPYPPSVAPLATLKKVHIDEMHLETHHRGFYAFLRVATPPYLMNAVQVIVEDEKGKGVMLQLYQQEDSEYGLAEDNAQIGGVCIVKEPYFQTMSNGEYNLRVDHVTDIIWLARDDSRIPPSWAPRISEVVKTAKELKEEGNAALKARSLKKAVRCYTKALRCPTTNEEVQAIKLNRSLANLKLRRYDDALADACDLPEEYCVSEKGVYRAARALYELQRFHRCREALQFLLVYYPNNAEAKEQLAQTEKRLREQENGEYDFKAMSKAAEGTTLRLNNATYTGPVAVKISEGRGRGLFTTRAVAAGELLLCEKAFAYCFASSEESAAGSPKTSVLTNPQTRRPTMGTQADLITASVQKLLQNPSLIPSFTALHHGDYNPVKETEVDGLPILDTFLTERITALNVFACPRRTTLDSFLRSQRPPEQQQNPHDKQRNSNTGIFIKASYINHSCNPNARRSFIGDMIIVRAARDVPADSEITFWYTAPAPNRTWESAQSTLRNWNFHCTCAICRQDKATSEHTHLKRRSLLGGLEEAFGATGAAAVDLPRAERLLAAMDETYPSPAKEVPRLELWEPYSLLIRTYAHRNRPHDVIRTVFKALASLGFVIIARQPPPSPSPSFKITQHGLPEDILIEIWTHLWTAGARVAPQLCRTAEECARVAYRVGIGEDETFDETVGERAREAMAGGGVDLGTAFERMRVR